MSWKWIFQIRQKPNKTIYRFLQLPLLKVQAKQKMTIFYIFGFMPVFCIETKKILQHKYKHVIKKLRTKDKINVGFLVRENCKWSYEKLFYKFEDNKHFNPIVLIVDTQHPVCDLDKNVEFFKKYKHCIIKTKHDFDNANIDILFYEQPWFDLDGDFEPGRIAKNTLTFYVPYGVEPDLYDNIMDYCAPFYRNVYKSFVFSEQMRPDFLAYNITNVEPVGHPRLDAFLDKPKSNNKIWKSKDKVRIVYAPHHTFQGSLHMWASWEWNGQHILELAKKYQDKTEWIFKPHPRFKTSLIQLLKMTPEQADNVFQEWSKVSTLYNTGDYLDLFKTADIMISDCCSFKIEWLPTGKPFIQLLSHYKNRQDYGKNTDYYSSAYYKADSVQDIDKFFDMLVNKHRDPNKNARQALAKEIPLDATDKVYNFVCNMVSKE